MSTTATHPKKQLIIKFFILCLVLAGYFTYLNIEYDLMTSGVAALLTWSFFVLCTPIADAGFLLDFPLRLLFGIRMIISEVVVWGFALLISIFSLIYFPNFYNTTPLTKVFHAILTTPYPYWAVILISGIGTFLSIRFGDEMMDIVSHSERKLFHKHGYKQELIIMVVMFAIIIIGYYELLDSLGIESIVEKSVGI
ncbi:MAG: hypothetical protein P1U74_10030 [Legionellaceae bacterium]|nr:hypothetical protein [Legionellaceae bacterium]